MLKPSNHPLESQRLAALRSYHVLDSLPEAVFDDLTKLAAHICDVPMATLSLIDKDRQWFKSRVGMDARETSRDVSFCGHAILGEGLMEVPDTHEDQRFVGNPLVVEGPKIRFYAGAPLTDENGLPLGTICVVDSKPRTLRAEQREALNALARLVVHQLEIRKTNLGLQDMLVSFSGEDPVKKERLAALGQLSGGVAHEINNPLAIITGVVEVITIKLRRNEGVEKELLSLKKATGRVAQVVSGLRNFAQQRSLSKSPVVMGELMQKLADRFKPLAESVGVKVSWPAEDANIVSADGPQMYMALEHIIKNAIEAAAKSVERSVKIETLREENFWVFRCIDSGAGIAPQNLQRLFEPFYTTKPPGEGQGLGLSVTRGIVLAHEGLVELALQSPTCFEVRLP